MPLVNKVMVGFSDSQLCTTTRKQQVGNYLLILFCHTMMLNYLTFWMGAEHIH
jgi:hypothetical protein